jgi:hypothetical protein
MAFVTTFLDRLDESYRTEELLDQLQIRLAGRAYVGRGVLPEPIPVIFIDDTPRAQQRAAVEAALKAVDPDWREVLSVIG